MSQGHYSYFPNEIDFDLFDIYSPKDFEGADRKYTTRDIQYMKEPLRIQTPWMTNAFGLCTYVHKGQQKDEHSIGITFADKDADCQLLKKFISALQEEVEALVQEESPLESGEKRNFKSCIKKDTKGKYPDHLRVKVYSNDVMVKCRITVDGEHIKPTKENAKDALKRGDKVRCIIELCKVYISGTDSGISFRLRQIQVRTKNRDVFR